MKKNPRFAPALLTVAASVPAGAAAALVLLMLRFNLLKLDIRSNARFTKGLSAAAAGVVGIDSTNDHRADESELVPPTSCLVL